MKYLDKYVIVNGWQIRGGYDSQFVHYGEVVDGMSDNRDGNIEIRYTVELYDDFGHEVDTVRRCEEENLENFELVDEVEEAEETSMDKERATRNGECPLCHSVNDFKLVYGRSVRFPEALETRVGEWQCMGCSYTFYVEDRARSIPSWLRRELERDRTSGELHEDEEDWFSQSSDRL